IRRRLHERSRRLAARSFRARPHSGTRLRRTAPKDCGGSRCWSAASPSRTGSPLPCAGSGVGSRISTDRRKLRSGRRSRVSMGMARKRRRLVVRSGTRGFMYWMVVWSLCLLGLLGSFTSRGLGLGVGMSGVAGWGGGGLLGVGLGGRGGGCDATGGLGACAGVGVLGFLGGGG